MRARGRLDDQYRPVDRLGRREPNAPNFMFWLNNLPGFAEQFKEVPADYYEGKRDAATINCPCGATVVATSGDMIACENCSRIYVWLLKVLLVGNSPVREEALTMS